MSSIDGAVGVPGEVPNNNEAVGGSFLSRMSPTSEQLRSIPSAIVKGGQEVARLGVFGVMGKGILGAEALKTLIIQFVFIGVVCAVRTPRMLMNAGVGMLAGVKEGQSKDYLGATIVEMFKGGAKGLSKNFKEDAKTGAFIGGVFSLTYGGGFATQLLSIFFMECSGATPEEKEEMFDFALNPLESFFEDEPAEPAAISALQISDPREEGILCEKRGLEDNTRAEVPVVTAEVLNNGEKLPYAGVAKLVNKGKEIPVASRIVDSNLTAKLDESDKLIRELNQKISDLKKEMGSSSGNVEDLESKKDELTLLEKELKAAQTPIAIPVKEE